MTSGDVFLAKWLRKSCRIGDSFTKVGLSGETARSVSKTGGPMEMFKSGQIAPHEAQFSGERFTSVARQRYQAAIDRWGLKRSPSA